MELWIAGHQSTLSTKFDQVFLVSIGGAWVPLLFENQIYCTIVNLFFFEKSSGGELNEFARLIQAKNFFNQIVFSARTHHLVRGVLTCTNILYTITFMLFHATQYIIVPSSSSCSIFMVKLILIHKENVFRCASVVDFYFRYITSRFVPDLSRNVLFWQGSPHWLTMVFWLTLTPHEVLLALGELLILGIIIIIVMNNELSELNLSLLLFNSPKSYFYFWYKKFQGCKLYFRKFSRSLLICCFCILKQSFISISTILGGLRTQEEGNSPRKPWSDQVGPSFLILKQPIKAQVRSQQKVCPKCQTSTVNSKFDLLMNISTNNFNYFRDHMSEGRCRAKLSTEEPK